MPPNAAKRQRIVHAHRAGPMHAMAEHATKRRFERERAFTIER